LSIYIGSLRSTKKSKDEDIEVITSNDAATFPLFASAALFGVYLVFKYVPKEYVNFLINLHFSIIGFASMARLLGPMFRFCIPKFLKTYRFELDFTRSAEKDNKQDSWEVLDKVSIHCISRDLVGILIAAGVGFWYFVTKHWIANNFVGMTLCVLAVEFIRLNKFVNGFLLLGGLFFYDIFWVFGTPVMVSVAKTLDAPIKVTFPRDLLENGIYAKQLALLGLGDIVVPGIFIAMLLRFDRSLNKQGGNHYFKAGFFAYIVGLFITFVFMHVFKTAQPALLYLVPTCISAPLALAWVKGELQAFLDYRDVPDDEADKASASKSNSANSSKPSEKADKKHA
jgi:minor histocompatibility antigen H13